MTPPSAVAIATAAPHCAAWFGWRVKCDNAEQLGKQLRQRYQRQQQRVPPGRAEDEAALDRLLGAE